MKLLELKKQHKELLDKAETFVAAAENANRQMNASEIANMTAAMTEAQALVPQIEALVKVNTMRNFDPVAMLSGSLTPKGERGFGSPVLNTHQRPMSTEYTTAFLSFLRSGASRRLTHLAKGLTRCLAALLCRLCRASPPLCMRAPLAVPTARAATLSVFPRILRLSHWRCRT